MDESLMILEKSLLPFYALFCVFVVFSYQEINNKIRSAYSSFREWVKFRLVSKPQEKVLLMGLGVDIEPDSWLEKDVIFQIFHFYKNVIAQDIVAYKKASKDYFDYAKGHLKFKEHILRMLLLLTILMIEVVATLSSIEYLYPSQHYWTLILFYIVSILTIFEVCRGPNQRLFNNTVTNRKKDACLNGTEKEIKELERLVNRI